MDDVIVKTGTVARMTFAEFAAFYDKAPPNDRWELIDGEAIKVAPASTTHIRIAGASLRSSTLLRSSERIIPDIGEIGSLAETYKATILRRRHPRPET